MTVMTEMTQFLYTPMRVCGISPSMEVSSFASSASSCDPKQHQVFLEAM